MEGAGSAAMSGAPKRRKYNLEGRAAPILNFCTSDAMGARWIAWWTMLDGLLAGLLSGLLGELLGRLLQSTEQPTE